MYVTEDSNLVSQGDTGPLGCKCIHDPVSYLYKIFISGSMQISEALHRGRCLFTMLHEMVQRAKGHAIKIVTQRMFRHCSSSIGHVFLCSHAYLQRRFHPMICTCCALTVKLALKPQEARSSLCWVQRLCLLKLLTFLLVKFKFVALTLFALCRL